MNWLKSTCKRFSLKYEDKRMEEEYDLIQGKHNIDNTKFTLYFVVFLLQIPGIPALINQNYLDAGIAATMGTILLIINYCKVIPKHYSQFILAIAICSFNNCLFLLPSTHIDMTSKGTMFFRGYAFASINLGLLARFSTLSQKIFFLAYAYAFRFTVLIIIDPSCAQALTISRHIYIDVFIAFTNFTSDKNKRLIFQKFYEYREELMKFKELLANYLPQSIAVFGGHIERTLFSNKSFSEIFFTKKEEAELNETNTQACLDSINKPYLKLLEVDYNSVREHGAKPIALSISRRGRSFGNFFEELNDKKILDEKTISFSASYSRQNEYKSFEVILTKIKWDTEDAVAVILNDITYQENLLRLKISNANKDRIIATVSHELRTPLNGILGLLDIARKRIEDQQALEYLELCKDNAQLLLSLVNSLLDLHQVREGKLRTNPAILDVKRVLEGVTRLFVFQCNQKGITLKFYIGDKAPKHIYTDENRLKQILINLIGNSLKFTSQGDITLEVDQDPENDEYLQISVSDTGIGIKEEDKSKLFQMYEKIEHGRNVNKNGVGLGLTISNTLAGILSGKKGQRVIEVISEVDKGSKFSFKILKNLEQPTETNASCLVNLVKNSEWDSEDELSSQEELQVTTGKHMTELASQNILFKLQSHSFISRCPSGQLLGRIPTHNPSPMSRYQSGDSLIEPKPPLSKLQKFAQNEQKGCILAVDDNPFNLLVARNIVGDLGYALKTAQSGQEAIEIMKLRAKEEAPFKAILMDCQMPVMDGFETTRKLRDMMEKGEVQNVPIIALTANSTEEDIKRCHESGMVGHLSKPLFVNALNKALSALQ